MEAGAMSPLLHPLSNADVARLREAARCRSAGLRVGGGLGRVIMNGQRRRPTVPGESVEDGSAGGDRGVRFEGQFMKTKVCSFWERGACKRGGACKYAHGYGELRNAPDLSRTAMCRSFPCDDPECLFAHCSEELRATDKFYKTTMCSFQLFGTCRLGSSCRHAHTKEELRGAKEEARKARRATSKHDVGLLTPSTRGANSNPSTCAESSLEEYLTDSGDELGDLPIQGGGRSVTMPPALGHRTDNGFPGDYCIQLPIGAIKHEAQHHERSPNSGMHLLGGENARSERLTHAQKGFSRGVSQESGSSNFVRGVSWADITEEGLPDSFELLDTHWGRAATLPAYTVCQMCQVTPSTLSALTLSSAQSMASSMSTTSRQFVAMAPNFMAPCGEGLEGGYAMVPVLMMPVMRVGEALN